MTQYKTNYDGDLINKAFADVNNIELNMNDVFSFACANNVLIDGSYWWLLIDLYAHFGTDGHIALASRIRQEEPLKITTQFIQAQQYIDSYCLDYRLVSGE